MKKRVIYYSDPLNDDFSGTKIKAKELNQDFIYLNKNPLYRLIAFIIYYFIAFPIISLYCIFYLRLRVCNRKVLRKFRRQGFFLYGNHTGYYDAFIHSILNFPKKSYVIANRDAVTIPGLGHIVMMLGAIPIPNSIGAMKKFTKAIETRYYQKNCITVFPEAHIWPYYNKIRPFSATSFRYPVKLNSPVVAMVIRYRRRLGPFKNRRPLPTIHFSDAIYPNSDLSLKEAQNELCKQVYDWMEDTLRKYGSYEYIKYIYQEK